MDLTLRRGLFNFRMLLVIGLVLCCELIAPRGCSCPDQAKQNELCRIDDTDVFVDKSNNNFDSG